MATHIVQPLGGQFGGATPYGNLTTLRYTLETNATGAPKNTVTSGALAESDVVKFAYPLPAGLVVEDLQVIVVDPFGTGVTADLGFAYADGEDAAALPQHAAAFGSGVSLATAARIRTNSARELVPLPKDAFLTLTIKGAAVAEAGKVQIIVHGERLGEV